MLRTCHGSRPALTRVNMMVPTCSGLNTLSKTTAFRYIHGPGLILSTLARAKIRYPEFTPIDHAARRETSRHPQLKILQTWKLRRHSCRCCRTSEPANQGVTVSALRPGSEPVNLTLLITTPAIMLDIASASELPHVRIRASEPGPLIDIPELLRYRDLLLTLAERDLRVRYKQTALGRDLGRSPAAHGVTDLRVRLRRDRRHAERRASLTCSLLSPG